MYNDLISRNIGIISKDDQKLINDSSIAIAGVGGVGGLLAERLIRFGIGKLNITDPGVFEETNFNRQFASNITTIEKEKAVVISEELQKINPKAKINYNIKGINTQEDANDFIKEAFLVIDEMDYGLFKQSVFLQRAARKKGIFYILSSAIGFGALVIIFEPNGCTLEEYNGLAKNINLDSIKQPEIPIDKILPSIPSYLLEKQNYKHMNSDILNQIIKCNRPAPTTSIGVGLASIVTANEVVNILLKKKKIITAPQYIHIDLLDRVYKIERQH